MTATRSASDSPSATTRPAAPTSFAATSRCRASNPFSHDAPPVWSISPTNCVAAAISWPCQLLHPLQIDTKFAPHEVRPALPARRHQ